MGISLSGGDYQYNRFDAYEEALEENRQAAMSAGESEGKSMMKSSKPAKVTGGKAYTMMGKDGKPLFKEGKDAESPEEMKKKVDKAGKKAKKTGRYLSDEDEKEEGEEEVSTAEGGDGMSEAFMDPTKAKRLGGLSPNMKMNQKSAELQGSEPGSTRQKKQTKATNQMNKTLHSGANMARRNEEINNEETGDTVMEDQMARYSRALGMMGKHYSGPSLEEKKELPDFIKDKVKEKHDKAHEGDDKKSKKDKEECNEGKMASKDYDGDGKVESGKEEYFGSKDKAIKKAMKKEDVSITKEMVVEYLVSEGYASNEVSAEILHTHVSDEFLAQIEEKMISE